MIAVQPCQTQDLVVRLARNVDMMFQDNLVLCQRAGLVRAEHVHGAEILDRIETLHNDLAARHRNSALGEVRGNDHRQHFRGKPNGDRKAEKHGFHPVAFGEAVDEEDHRHHDQHEADQQPANAVNAAIEGCLGARADNRLGERPEVSALTGGDHNGGGGAADDIGTHKADAGQVEHIRILGGCCHGRFL